MEIIAYSPFAILVIYVIMIFVSGFISRHKNENSTPVSGDIEQLIMWSAFGVLLSFGIIRLIIEAVEGGMSLEPERTFGVFFFIVFSATLVIMVIPETVRLLKELGYIRPWLETKRKFLNKYRLGH